MNHLEPGRCPRCDAVGEVGTLCAQEVCTRRGCHHIPQPEHQRSRTSRDGMLGQRLGDYLIVGHIGRGGFGSVYLALQLPIMMKVALKLVRARAPELADDATLLLFEREAMALSRLGHPNIVRLFHYGRHRDHPYLVLEFLEQAWSLRDEIRDRHTAQRVIEPWLVSHLMAQVANGLTAAHDHEIIHRDVKPGNIMLQKMPGEPWHVRLVDFGLAKLINAKTRSSAGTMGTPIYMAPEQLNEGMVGPWTDCYAMGVIAFELLCGVAPYPGRHAHEILTKKLDPTYDPVKATPAIASMGPLAPRFFKRALAREPRHRFQSPREFAEVLTGISSALERTDRLAVAPALAQFMRHTDTQALNEAEPAQVDAQREVKTLRENLTQQRKRIRLLVVLLTSLSILSLVLMALLLSH